MAMIDELVDAVARAAQLPSIQAAQAVDGMLRFLGARLPSPLFGELQARLQAAPMPPGGPAGSRPPPASP